VAQFSRFEIVLCSGRVMATGSPPFGTAPKLLQTLQAELDPSEVFAPKSALPRSPRPDTSLPDNVGSPSTLEKVLQEKEARRAAEEAERLALLREARIEHFRLRKLMLSSSREAFLDTTLVLDWSHGAELGKTFAHKSLSRCDPEEAPPEMCMSLSELRQQWIEASCLLRANLSTVGEYESARRTVRNSLDFLDRLLRLAATHSESLAGGTGTIFQELLKDLASCGVSGIMIDNVGAGGGDRSFDDAARESALAAQLGCADEWPVFLRQAQDMRCIVRIKLQDANDLRAAHYALECCSTCFNEIQAHAQMRNISQYEMVSQVLEGGLED
jgi:hypothetical protein